MKALIFIVLKQLTNLKRNWLHKNRKFFMDRCYSMKTSMKLRTSIIEIRNSWKQRC